MVYGKSRKRQPQTLYTTSVNKSSQFITETDFTQAIKAGYRLFDGAYDYQNEKEAGEGIQRAIADGLVTRPEIFITTKLWNNYHRREHAIEMAKKQNDAWGLGYIDLFLMHFPCALKYIDPSIRQYPVRSSDITPK